MAALSSNHLRSLSILVAIVTSPGEAFEQIRREPAWLWPLLATIAASAIGSILGTPAAHHMVETVLPVQLANDPRVAGLPPDQAKTTIDQMIARGKTLADYAWLFSAVFVLVSVFFEAGILFALRALLRARAGFAQILALTASVQFIALGLFLLVQGIIVALRPLDTIRTQTDFLTSVPSLAWVVPGAPEKLVIFLSSLGPFQIWGTIVMALGLIAVAGFRPAAAWTASVLISLAGAGWSAFFVK